MIHDTHTHDTYLARDDWLPTPPPIPIPPMEEEEATLDMAGVRDLKEEVEEFLGDVCRDGGIGGWMGGWVDGGIGGWM
jgi:hypothetical protein